MPLRITTTGSAGSVVGTVTRDSRGRITGFGTLSILTRDSAGRVKTFSDSGVTYSVSYGSLGVTGVATA